MNILSFIAFIQRVVKTYAYASYGHMSRLTVHYTINSIFIIFIIIIDIFDIVNI